MYLVVEDSINKIFADNSLNYEKLLMTDYLCFLSSIYFQRSALNNPFNKIKGIIINEIDVGSC